MKHLLSSTAFIVLNKNLAKQVGLKEAVLLADLISKEEYFIANGMTDGWFFNTEANIEKDTTLNPYHQRKCIKKLKEKGLIEIKRKGIPAKQYFKKPGLLEVKNYCILRKNNIDAEAFIAFYESKGWMIGKNKMKDWKQAVITWEKRNYKKPTMSKLDAQLSQYEQAKKLL